MWPCLPQSLRKEHKSWASPGGLFRHGARLAPASWLRGECAEADCCNAKLFKAEITLDWQLTLATRLMRELGRRAQAWLPPCGPAPVIASHAHAAASGTEPKAGRRAAGLTPARCASSFLAAALSLPRCAVGLPRCAGAFRDAGRFTRLRLTRPSVSRSGDFGPILCACRARATHVSSLAGRQGRTRDAREHGRGKDGQASAQRGSPAASRRATAGQFSQAQSPGARPCGSGACVRASGRGEFERKRLLSVFLPALPRRVPRKHRLRRKHP
jgi:hypothetical protein